MADVGGSKQLDLEPLLYFGDAYIQAYEHLPYCSHFTYGHNSLHLMTGYLKMHPDYAQTIINNFRGMSLARSLSILKIVQKVCHSTDRNNFNMDIFNAALEETKGMD